MLCLILDPSQLLRCLLDIRSRMTFKLATLLRMQVYSVYDLEPFYGDAKSAFDAACHDDKQYVTKRVISYAGNCARRTEMGFTCEYEDGTIAEITWTRDILCEAFYDFCKTKPYLYHLTLDTKDAA